MPFATMNPPPSDSCRGPVRFWPALALALLLPWLLSGCSESISVVTVPSDIPNNWEPAPAAAMRFNTYLVADEHGHTAEISSLPMRRLNIADGEFVNMWREQVGLPEVSEAQVADLKEAVPIGGQTGVFFDLTGPATDDPDHAMRILAAYLHQDELTWFFKLTGPSHLVETEKADFLQYLRGVNLRKMTSDFLRREELAQAPPTAPQLPEWTVPGHWRATASQSSIILDSFRLSPGALLTVSQLSGDGGGMLLNVNRWREQIALMPVTAEELPALLETPEIAGRETIWVDMTGPDERIVTAVVPDGGHTWFFKVMGEPLAVETEISHFRDFLESVSYPSDG